LPIASKQEFSCITRSPSLLYKKEKEEVGGEAGKKEEERMNGNRKGGKISQKKHSVNDHDPA